MDNNDSFGWSLRFDFDFDSEAINLMMRCSNQPHGWMENFPPKKVGDDCRIFHRNPMTHPRQPVHRPGQPALESQWHGVHDVKHTTGSHNPIDTTGRLVGGPDPSIEKKGITPFTTWIEQH